MADAVKVACCELRIIFPYCGGHVEVSSLATSVAARRDRESVVRRAMNEPSVHEQHGHQGHRAAVGEELKHRVRRFRHYCGDITRALFLQLGC